MVTSLHYVSRGDVSVVIIIIYSTVKLVELGACRIVFFFSQYLNQLSEGKHGQKTGMVAHEIIFPIVFNLGANVKLI